MTMSTREYLQELHTKGYGNQPPLCVTVDDVLALYDRIEELENIEAQAVVDELGKQLAAYHKLLSTDLGASCNEMRDMADL